LNAVVKTPLSTIINQPGGVAGMGANGRTSAPLRDFVSVKDFGAIGDGVTDDLAAFVAAHDYFPIAGKIIIPQGSYYLSDTWVITRRLNIVGNQSGQQAVNSASRLIFPANKTGLRFHSLIEQGSGSSARSSVQDLCISAVSKGATGHGIHASATVYLDRVNVDGFKQNGINIVAGSVLGTGDANQWSIRDSRSSNNGGSGLYVEGPDVNSGHAINLDAASNGEWGIYDSSLLGNTYLACHISNCGIGAVKSEGGVNSSLFLGTYIEGYGNFGCEIESPAMVFGGTAGAMSDYPFVTITGDGAGAKAYATSNGAVSRIVLDNPGSGYTEAAVSIHGGSGSGATANAIIQGGQVVGFTIIDGGSNYPHNSGLRVKIKDEGAPGGFVTGRIRSTSAPLSEWPSNVQLNGTLDTSIRLQAVGANNIDVRFNKTAGSWDYCSNLSLASSSLRFVTSLSENQTGGRSSALPNASLMFPLGYWIGGGSAARHQTNGTAAPTTGEWAAGDIVWNRSPAPGGFAGWICTAAGTPGTWKPFGAISA